MLTKIYLDTDNYKRYKTGNDDGNSLSDLNRINIFIGANNSGKSRLIRTLFADRGFEIQLKGYDLIKLSDKLEKIHQDLKKTLDISGLSDVSSNSIPSLDEMLKKTIQDLRRPDILRINAIIDQFSNQWKNLLSFEAKSYTQLSNRVTLGINLPNVSVEIRRIIQNNDNFIKISVPDSIKYYPNMVYIPILRGLRPTQMHGSNDFDVKSDNYRSRTIKDYFEEIIKKEQSIKDEIYTGLSLYEDLKEMLLGNREERKRVRDFENFLSETFFNGDVISLTPHGKGDCVKVLIHDDERPIYELGDGIQSIIILLYPLFFNQGKKLLVFMEEPEKSMHPGLQRLFIETLMLDKFKSFQYFITTHSNNFLDITLEHNNISVYTLKRKRSSNTEDDFLIENVSNADSQILDLIGARSSSVFLSNCTIWVEGITDRLYLKRYLEVYQKDLHTREPQKPIFKEDFEFSFVEYGGGNIVHWSFIDEDNFEKINVSKISKKIFLVTDRDNTNTKTNTAKARRLALLKESLDENFKLIDGKEIENTLSPKILIDTIKALEKNEATNVEFKTQILSNVIYKDSGLGKFIEDNIVGIKRKYKANSGTISCKVEFCKTAVEQIKDIVDLSEEGRLIVEALYKFIETSNQ